MGWTSKLPFGLDSEARKKKWEEYGTNRIGAIDVHVFGTDKFQLQRGSTMGYVRIFNEKLNIWQNEPCHDYYDICSVCGKLMHVYVVPGTTYIAACSKECYNFIGKLMKEEKPDVRGD